MTDPTQARSLQVHCELPGPGPEAPALLRLRVQDVSIADRAATVLVQKDLPVDPFVAALDVTLEVAAGLIDERALYSVFAHLDLGATGEIKTGDALTTQSFPVLTRGEPDEIRITLTRI